MADFVQRYCGPLHHPCAPGLSLSSVRLVITDRARLKVLDPKWPIREADIGAQPARALRCGSRDDLGGAKRFGEGPLCGIVR